jgi:hypothetical protein
LSDQSTKISAIFEPFLESTHFGRLQTENHEQNQKQQLSAGQRKSNVGRQSWLSVPTSMERVPGAKRGTEKNDARTERGQRVSSAE